MNRKVATLIILVVFIISLVVISIIGTVQLDWSQNIIVTEIYISDVNGNRVETTDINGTEMAQIEVELEPLENTFVFYYTIVPNKADNKKVEFIYDTPIDETTGKPYISIVGSGGSAVITFNNQSILDSGFVVIIRCQDGSEKYTSVVFVRKQVTSGETDL